MQKLLPGKRSIIVVGGIIILISLWGNGIQPASAQTGTPVESVPLAGIVDIEAKSNGTCAVTAAGGVECWSDFRGASNILGVEDVVMLEGGTNHACAITGSGEVKCWGSNDYGQLGDQGTERSYSTAVKVNGLPGKATDLAAGYRATCAIVDGGVYCWGGNLEGELGDGTTADHDRPVRVTTLPAEAVALGGGFSHTCALLEDGSVWCWGGYGFYYGIDETLLLPVKVNGLPEGVKLVEVGDSFACALTAEGSMWCWGYNSDGQLGDGSTENRSLPVNVKGLPGQVTSFSVGDKYVCVLIDGSLACWGDNRSGQLGDGTRTDRSTPVAVIGLTEKVIDLTASHEHTCALLESGEVRCWGHNGYEQLGNGVEAAVHIPVDVVGLKGGITGLFAGGDTSCAVDAGKVLCWGANGSGQLGDGTDLDSSLPVGVQGLSGGVKSLSIGWDSPCAITGSGVHCWGFQYFDEFYEGFISNATSIAVGEGHTCVVDAEGAVLCAGYNGYGQLGDGTLEYRSSPVPVSGLNGRVTALAAGGYHTCAATAEAVFCWGANEYGQLGDGTTEDRSSPIKVNGLGSGVVALSLSDEHSCALTGDGKVQCWGNNAFGQLGDGSQSDSLTPVIVKGLPGKVSLISCGLWHTCALLEDGKVVCWGNNSHGQSGSGMDQDSLAPIPVNDLAEPVIALACGELHTCASTADAVKCWGSNNSGQLGNGIDPYSTKPVTVILGPRRQQETEPGGFRSAGPLVPQITTYIPTPLDVSTKPGVIGTNLLLAALMMLPFAVAAELFTRTMTEHEEILRSKVKPVDWIGRLKQRMDSLAGTRLGRHPAVMDTLKLIGVMFFYGLIFSLLDRTWNPFSLKGLVLFLSMTIAYGIVGIADDIMQFRLIRKWRLPVELNLRPTNVLIAVLSTTTSRLFGLVPGLMFGTPEALQVDEAQLDQEKRNRLLKISALTFVVVGLGVWSITALTGLLQRLSLGETPANLVAGLEAFFLVIFAVALENSFVQMLGFAGSFGQALKRKNRWLWLVGLFGVAFVFYHTLLNPRGELVAALQEGNVRLFLGVAAAFVLVAFGLWLYYRWQERRSARSSQRMTTPVLPASGPEIPEAGQLRTETIPGVSRPAVPPAEPLQIESIPATLSVEVPPAEKLQNKPAPVVAEPPVTPAEALQKPPAPTVPGPAVPPAETLQIEPIPGVPAPEISPAEAQRIESIPAVPTQELPPPVPTQQVVKVPLNLPTGAQDQVTNISINETKQCPVCHHPIKAEARICRFCRATFTIVVRGYCMSDHALVDATGQGKCVRCGAELTDLHVESRLLKAPDDLLAQADPVGTAASRHPAQVGGATRTCPSCGQVIKAEARICRFCRTRLD